MITYLLDTSGLIRLVQHEAGADRIEQILEEASMSRCRAIISAVNWGEVRYVLTRRIGLSETDRTLEVFLSTGLSIVSVTAVTAERAERAALIKVNKELGLPTASVSNSLQTHPSTS